MQYLFKDIEILYDYVGEKVAKLVVRIWPPFNEESNILFDISVGLTFENNTEEIFFLVTDENDLWTPLVLKEKNREFTIFNTIDQLVSRIEKWKLGKLNDIIDYEYYDLTSCEIFNYIIGYKLKEIHKITVGEEGSFGIKLGFDKDFIISTPISSGSTFETRNFNKNENIKYFKTFGEVKILKLKEMI